MQRDESSKVRSIRFRFFTSTAMSILRRGLSVPLSNGHTSFILPCKKLIFEYSEVWGSNGGLKDFLAKDVVALAEANPGVECVVRRRENKHPVVRGVYGAPLRSLASPAAELTVRLVNGRSKEICLRNLTSPAVAIKVQLLLDASGQKIAKLKRPKVESTTESVRGIWSPFHTSH